MTQRCCYFVQTHRDPAQVYRLLGTLRRGSPRAHIVVQHNPAACELSDAALTRLGAVRLPALAYHQERGRYSCQVEPTLDTMGWLERNAVDYDWLITLTGQDYPVQSLAISERWLGDSDAAAFLRYWAVDSPDNPWPRSTARHRYHHRYWRLPDRTAPWMRVLRPLVRLLPGAHLSVLYGPNLGIRVRTPWRRLRLYGGWAWGALRRDAVRLVLRYLRDHPDLVDFYRGTLTPEESMLQTVLLNAGSLRVENDDLRYMDYGGTRSGSPRVLGSSDWPTLASGRFAFARKFDPAVDGAILERIDRELLGRLPATAAG